VAVRAALSTRPPSSIRTWDVTALSHLSTSAITNEFAYNRFAPGPFGLQAQMGARATITLPAVNGADIGSLRNAATLQLRTVNGNTFNVAVRPG
jgi:thiosulfate dehydrogenase (quinone)